MKKSLNLHLLQNTFAVCKLSPFEIIPSWATQGEFYSVSKTADELSIVCDETNVPPDIKTEGGWRCLKVAGPLDFALTGILASLATPLAEAVISIFAISTFDTDYLLIKQSDLDRAMIELRKSGHIIN